MSAYYYLLDYEKNEAYELGKHISYSLEDDLLLLLTDEFAFKYTLLKDLNECNGIFELSYAMKVVNNIWKFCKNRNHKSLIVIHEEQMYDYTCFHKCKLIDSRYEAEDIEDTNKKWKEHYDRSIKKHNEKEFQNYKFTSKI